MRKEVTDDMDRSSALFVNQVWPLCVEAIGGGSLMQMEGRPDSELARELDMRAGIDGWHVHHHGLRGIASRVQVGNDWSTFTVRMSRDSGTTTEYEKRLRAITTRAGLLFPALTIQAYAATWDGPVISIGIVHTTGLIDFIQKRFHFERRTTNARFAVCSWSKMIEKGYEVIVMREESGAAVAA